MSAETHSKAVVTGVQRDIVRTSFDNPHSDLGNRVLTRVSEKRPEFARYIRALGPERRMLEGEGLTHFLDECVASVSSTEKVYGMHAFECSSCTVDARGVMRLWGATRRVEGVRVQARLLGEHR